jgi:type I restriction enzyme, S subunit
MRTYLNLEASVPDGWLSVALGEIADVNWGNTSLTKKSYSESGFTAYSATGPDGCIDHAEFSGPGIVLSAIGARSGKCFLADGQWTAIKNTITIIPFSPISTDWLFRAINRESAWKKRGGAQPFIALKDAISLPILLPPLAEQKRIVKKVDELMALCDRLEAQQQEREMRHDALALASLARFADAPDRVNLTLLFHSSYAIAPADLRKSILSLAVKGKLVPQDPDDEPAVKLLERIELEKSRRLLNGTIRNLKPVAPITEVDKEFELPRNWEWVRMGQVVKLWNGFAFKATDFQTAGIPVIRIGDLQDGLVDLTNAVCVSEDVARTIGQEFWIPENALLIAMSGATTGKVAINKTGRRLLLNQRVGRLEPLLVSTDYVRFFFETIVSRNLSISFGSAIPNLSAEQINGTFLPLPPLAEQRRIVEKLDQMMALVDALETQLAASRRIAINLVEAVVSELSNAA